MRSYLDRGYSVVKKKIGGASLADDCKRIEHVLKLLPSGAKGPAFLALPNHYVIRNYNNSTAYALAVGQAAGPFRGVGLVWGAGVRLGWTSGATLFTLSSAPARLGADLDLTAAWTDVDDTAGSVRVSTWSVAPRASLRLFMGATRAAWVEAGAGARLGVARLVGSPTDPASFRGGSLAGIVTLQSRITNVQNVNFATPASYLLDKEIWEFQSGEDKAQQMLDSAIAEAKNRDTSGAAANAIVPCVASGYRRKSISASPAVQVWSTKPSVADGSTSVSLAPWATSTGTAIGC
jgi:hypothetical protein